jgi:ActR/RegA family two-component response regulator
MLAKKTSDIG